MKIEEKITIVIPVRKIDPLTEICLEEIESLYPKVNVVIIADQLVPYSMKNLTQLQSKTTNIADKRNEGVSHSETPYIAFIDSDAYPCEGWLEIAVEFLESSSKVAAVGGPNLEHLKCDDNQRIPYLASLCPSVGREPIIKTSSLEVKTIASSNMIVRRSSYVKLGGMNSKIKTGEDIEFCYRLGREYKIHFLRDCIVRHRQRKFSGFVKQRYIWGRGILNVFQKTFPYYSVSLIPLISVITAMILIVYDGVNQTQYTLYTIVFYFLVIFLTVISVTKKISEIFLILPYALSSIPLMGIGGLVSLVKGDISDEYKGYNNNE
ncbi:MAG: hypothetical protein CME65_10725 [Halobacteriovoraceae bacterium]|nr:hypothetical protein [Halobacteriovoraceae bacterium]|tara:strand:- start:4215 stop:5177 length:963 start_codon:yes stop_codon:yes gene_type:complete